MTERTVQQHYNHLNNEFGNVRVNNITTHNEITFDMGDYSTIDGLTEKSTSVVETLKRLGYTPIGEPVVSAGYVGAYNEKLILTVQIEENPYENGVDSLN